MQHEARGVIEIDEYELEDIVSAVTIIAMTARATKEDDDNNDNPDPQMEADMLRFEKLQKKLEIMTGKTLLGIAARQGTIIKTGETKH